MAKYRFPEPIVIHKHGEKLQSMTSDAGVCIAKTAQRIRDTESEGTELQERAQERIRELESLLHEASGQRAEAEQRCQGAMEAVKQAQSLIGRLNAKAQSLAEEIKQLQARNAQKKPDDKENNSISLLIQQKMFELRQIRAELGQWGTRLKMQLEPKLMQEQAILQKIRTYEMEIQTRGEKLTAVKSRLDSSLEHLSSWFSEWENSENESRKKSLTEGMGETGMEMVNLSDQISQNHWGVNHG